MSMKILGIDPAARKPKRKLHGLRYSHEYRIWIAMKQRCYNKETADFKNYGGRGIVVCDRWLESVENFVADMGLVPSKLHTIDRVDVDGNYEPKNCVWATRSEQNRNRRKNRIITFNGKTMCVVDWAKEIGVPVSTLTARLNKGGWTEEQALTGKGIRYAKTKGAVR